MDTTPKRSAQRVCRICREDLSERRIVQYNLFKGTPPLHEEVETVLQLDTIIQEGDGYPPTICRRCKTDVEFIIKAEGKRDALIKKHAETSAAIRKKHLPRTPAEERAEQSYGQFKVPTLATDSHRHWRVARKIDLGWDNATEVTETPHYTSTAALPPQEKDTVRLQTRHCLRHCSMQPQEHAAGLCLLTQGSTQPH